MSRRFYPWALVAVLWVVALLNYLDRQIIFSVFPLLQSEMKLTSVQLGLLGTAFLWVYGILSPLGGYLADRFGSRRLILLSLIVWSAVTFTTGYARTFNELVAARAAMGISEACYLPAALALVVGWHGTGTRSLAVGVHQSGLYVGIVLGGAGGGWLAQQYGWRYAFLLLGAIGVAYALIVGFSVRDVPSQSGSDASSGPKVAMGTALRELLATPGFVRFVISAGLTAWGYWIVYSWMPLFLYEKFHMDLARAGFTSTFYTQAGSFAAILAGGVIADRWSRRNPAGRLYTLCLGLALAGPGLLLVTSAHVEWVAAATLVAFGIGRGFNDCNVMPVLCLLAPQHLRATGFGIINFVTCLSGGLMVALGGAMRDRIGLAAAIQLSAVAIVVGAGLAFGLRHTVAPVPVAAEAKSL